MVALTDAQKKRLKAHSKTQTIAHIKKMASLMRGGKSFSEAHTSAKKSDAPKQKQKQTQSQKVVVNIGRDVNKSNRKRRKPRESTRGGSSRVLGQFVPLPPYGMFPAPPPPNASASAFQAQAPRVVSPAGVANAFAPRPQTLVSDSVPNVVGVRNPAPPPLVPTQAGQVPSLERFFTNLPLTDAPPSPPSVVSSISMDSMPAENPTLASRAGSSRDMDDFPTPPSLRRQGSLQRQRSLPEVLEYEKVAAATKRYQEEEAPEAFIANTPDTTRQLARSKGGGKGVVREMRVTEPIAQTDFRTKEGAQKRDLADAFRGKTLAKTAFEGLRGNVEREQARAMARDILKQDTTSFAGAGGGGSMAGRGFGSLIAPPPALASSSRNYEAAEEEGY